MSGITARHVYDELIYVINFIINEIEIYKEDPLDALKKTRKGLEEARNQLPKIC